MGYEFLQIFRNFNDVTKYHQSSVRPGVELLSSETVVLDPFVPTPVSTKIEVSFPEGFRGRIRSLHSVVLKGITVVGNVILDEPQETKVELFFVTSDPTEIHIIKKRDKIAQLVFEPLSNKRKNM